MERLHIYKFGSGEIDQEFLYEDTWCIEKHPNYERITVAPRDNQINLMLDILSNFEPPYWCLYVLCVSRVGNESGRYQCPYPLSFIEIKDLVIKYKNFFETDGRHHFWIGSTKSKQLLVYDHHNVIYVYNDLLNTRQYLKNRGFSEKKIEFPVPHAHMYNQDNDKFEIDIMTHWEWNWFPLMEQDKC